MNDKKKRNSESSDYREEMEELARIFKEELDKAVQESEDSADIEAIEDLEIEGYNPREVSVENAAQRKALTEDELCECCGEKPRGTEKNPNSPFCSDCEEILERYPYDWKGIVTAIAAIFITLAAVVSFAINVPVFSYTVEGEKAYNDNKLYTSLQKYDRAVESMVEGTEKEYLNVYKKRILTNYALLDMDSVLSDAGTYFTENAKKMPMYKDVAKIEDEIIGMQASVLVIQDVLSQYDDVTEKNYNEILKSLDELSGKKIYVSGSSYHLETEKDFTPTGEEDVYVCEDAWISMYKYSAAQYIGKDEKTIAEFLAEASKQSGYLSRLVNPLLAATYVGIGEYDKAEALMPEIKNANGESVDYHMVQSMLYRYRDKDYQKGVDICIEGLNNLAKVPDGSEMIAQLGYILSMQKTLNYIMMDDYEKAFESAHECYSYQSESYAVSVQVRDMYAMLALEVGDTDVYTTLKDEIAEYGEDSIGFSQDVENYRKGNVTLEELAMGGGYDLL